MAVTLGLTARRWIQVAFGLAVAAWAVAALGAAQGRSPPGPGPAPGEASSAAGRALVRTHERALATAGARLAGLEARPPEVLSRTLAELGSVYSEFTRLLVCDASGRVLAAWPAAAASLVGAPDPAVARRAMLAAPARPHVGERSGGATLELGVGVAASELYVAGDLPRAAALATSHRAGGAPSRGAPLLLLLSCVLVAAAAVAFVISSKRPS